MKSAPRSFLIALTVLSGSWLVQGLVEAQAPEQQIVSDAAEALGGRDRILAVRTLLIEGQGKDFSFGQGARPDEMGSESDPWKVTGYKRAYDLASGRSRFEQTRVSLDAFYAGPDPGKSVQGIDGMVVYDVGETGNASRVWNRLAMEGRRADVLRHPLLLLRVALAPDAKLANGRTQGSERLVDISVAGGPTVTLAIDAATKRPTRVVHVTDVPLIGDAPIETRFADYRTVDGPAATDPLHHAGRSMAERRHSHPEANGEWRRRQSRRARERGVSDAAVRAGADSSRGRRGRQGHLVHDRTDSQQRSG